MINLVLFDWLSEKFVVQLVRIIDVLLSFVFTT